MIGMYEQDRKQPNISTLIKLSNYFNLTTDYLLGRIDNSSKPCGYKYMDEELEEI